jgi:hypothetical protein
MNHHPTRALAGALCAGLLLAGCSGDPQPVDSSSTPSASATGRAQPSGSTSPAPTSTLTAEEQQAFEEATEAVRAYAQTFYNILSDPTPTLNDLNAVAAQPQLALDLKSLQGILSAGEITFDKTGPVFVAAAEPTYVNLEGDPPTIVVVACVDRSANSGTEAGDPWTGRRQQSRYQVVKTDYLPQPGWAVAKVLPPEGYDQPQPC